MEDRRQGEVKRIHSRKERASRVGRGSQKAPLFANGRRMVKKLSYAERQPVLLNISAGGDNACTHRGIIQGLEAPGEPVGVVAALDTVLNISVGRVVHVVV